MVANHVLCQLSYTPDKAFWDLKPEFEIPEDWLRGRDLNPRPLGYAYHYSFRCPAQVCGPDFPFALAHPIGCR